MARRTRLRHDSTTTQPATVRRRKPDPLAWSKALDLADGHPRRLVTLEDGSVLVLRPGQSRP